MTGFWDAIGRAVLGQAGTAVPRPRSLFEPGGAEIALGEEPDATLDMEPVPQELQVPASSRRIEAPPEGPRWLPAPAPGSFADASVGPNLRTPGASVPAAPPVVTPPERIDVTTIERLGSPASPVHIERVEHHHLETTRVIVEPAPLLHVLADNDPTAGTPDEALEPDEPNGNHSLVATPADVSIDQPIPVVAAPPVVSTEPAAALSSPESLPPLIVEIEHLDIRITSDRVASPPPPSRQVQAPAPSLGEYLARRSEGRR